ncbi:hypothetical protein GYMLUDRAFT_59771 [Collybiopsis luxurians FD-317 M1]|uniref:Uncharacterized protein n=1 Tax=Collybiopsis luxurians FD-317 M1 TaxID=944289 RepID=A0A0D0CVM6_9AGAR|nr:hypothetical protein GYMLUDRAFT_59771 [Collybiopsis luxurians FD-317 M1]
MSDGLADLSIDDAYYLGLRRSSLRYLYSLSCYLCWFDNVRYLFNFIDHSRLVQNQNEYRNRPNNSNGHWILFACISLATPVLTLNIFTIPVFLEVFNLSASVHRATYVHRFSQGLLFSVSVIIGDFLTVWRACTIWPSHRGIRLLLGLLVVVNTGLQGIFLDYEYGPLILSTIPSKGEVLSLGSFVDSNFGGIIISLTINIVSASLIGFKAWQHRTHLLALGFKRHKFTSATIVLLVWFESGLFFCAVQAFYATLTVWNTTTIDQRIYSNGTDSSIQTQVSAMDSWVERLLPFIMLITTSESLSNYSCGSCEFEVIGC